MDTKAIDKNEYLLISQVANFLGVAQETLRRWDRSGKIRTIRLDGKNRYFLKSDLEKMRNEAPLEISDAARELGVSVSTLRRLDNAGKISFRKATKKTS